MDRTKLEQYRTKLLDKRAALERAKIMQEEYLKLKASHDSIQDLSRRCLNHLTRLEQLKKVVDCEDASFRERRITFLSEHITQELLKIFPTKGYQAKIDCDFKRGSGMATLTLLDKYDVERIPEITEGKLCQYLISFASTVGAIKGLNTNNIYIDEAFGVSSSSNLPKIGDILQSTAQEGIQLILISQNSNLYANIERREIHLEFNDLTDSSSVTEIIDF